jgi:AhpD family alkylhydroperoxidase
MHCNFAEVARISLDEYIISGIVSSSAERRTTMTETYETTMNDIEATFGIVPGFLEGLPEEDLVNEWPTFKKYVVAETEIPAKYRELIGLAVAANTKCQYCLHFHRGAAQLQGATEEELAEISFLASTTARYSAMLHAQEYDLDTFKEETARIAEHFQQGMAAADD